MPSISQYSAPQHTVPDRQCGHLHLFMLALCRLLSTFRASGTIASAQRLFIGGWRRLAPTKCMMLDEDRAVRWEPMCGEVCERVTRRDRGGRCTPDIASMPTVKAGA